MKKKIEILLRTVRICSQDVGIGFEIEKCAMLIRKKEKKETTEGIDLPKLESIWSLEEKKVPVNSTTGTIKQRWKKK